MPALIYGMVRFDADWKLALIYVLYPRGVKQLHSGGTKKRRG